MSAKELSNEKNTMKIEITVSAEDFQKAVNQSYNKNKKHYSVPGFRKGKVPKKIVELHYGKGAFYEDAIDFAFPDAYKNALEELKIEPVSRPAMEEVKEIGENGAIFIISVALKPEVKLNDYKGAEIDSLEPTITEEDILAEISKMAEKNARIVSDENAEAKKGDTVIIDYEGFADGEAFDGGKGEDHPLELGSNTFIPGFEEQLIGTKAGTDMEVKVTFPEEYHSEALAGKEATFKTKVKEVQVKELPEMDDEFAKDVSEFDSLEELKADTAKTLEENKKTELRRAAETKVLEHAIENSEMDIPELMIDEEAERTLEGYTRQMEGQGISLEDYFKFTGTTIDQFKENMRPDIERNLKSEFILAAVADAENIEVSEEELNEEIKVYADTYSKDLDEFKETVNETMADYMKADIKRRKAVDSLINAAKVK